MIEKGFWKDKKIFLTGHTGFKGSWLCLWLVSMGAKVTGYALEPPTEPSLFNLCKIDTTIKSIVADVRDRDRLSLELNNDSPEIIIHMAAQSLVRESYLSPVDTYSTNVMGTVNLFEAARFCNSIKAVINVTSDKCYENDNRSYGYKEDDPLGGYDPYSSSKACSELVTSAYLNSYFNPKNYSSHGVGVASARAGNVIGGGDWAQDRLIPDCIRAFLRNDRIRIRNPQSTRPWQHVMEPLGGYLLLAQKLSTEGARFCGSWNFGPNESDVKPVDWVAGKMCERLGMESAIQYDESEHPHEAGILMLDHTKSRTRLKWRPKWNLELALESIAEWVKGYKEGQDINKLCLKQIGSYANSDKASV